MSNRLSNPIPQFLDSSGQPLSGGFLFFYLTGTSTKTDTYSDAALTTPNANPMTLNSAGRPATDIFLDPNITYKMVLTASTDTDDPPSSPIVTADPVVDFAANVTAAFQVYNGDPNGNVAGNSGAVGGSGASVVWDIANNLLYICTTTGTASTAVWSQQNADLSGALLAPTTISPASIGADQDDYAPTGFASAYSLRLQASAAYAITGIAGGAAGRMLTVHNIGSFRITLKTENTASTAANRFATVSDVVIDPGKSVELYYDGTSSRWRVGGSMPFLPGIMPGGRLTLTTATPVLTADTTAQTTVYYTPYLSNAALISDGVTISAVRFSELSQTLADATKSPAAGAVDSLYDMFVWDDAGTLRCTRGPAWSSATARGTGAGTTELDTIEGVLVNKVAITNGPGALKGVYVGTIATDGNGANGQLSMNFTPAAAAGGAANRLDVWNMYNRVAIAALSRDSTDTWNYTTATVRSANNSTSNRITFVRGRNEDILETEYHGVAGNSSSGIQLVTGIGIDSTSVISGIPGNAVSAGSTSDREEVVATYKGLPGLGQHYAQALEYSEASGTTQWAGDDGGSVTQMGLYARMLM